MAMKNWFGSWIRGGRAPRRSLVAQGRATLTLERLEARDTPSAGRGAMGVSTPPWALTGGAPTSTTLAAAAATFVVQAPITFTATVWSPAASILPLTGQVVFQDRGHVLGTVSLSGNAATFTTAALGAGPHWITASYSGDSHFAASVSAAWQQQVAATPTRTTLLGWPSPGVFGRQYTLAAYVSPRAVSPNVASSPASHLPTGYVDFKEGNVLLGRVKLTGSVATLKLGKLSPGQHVVTAYYEGDANHNRSPLATVTVGGAFA